MKKHIKLFEEFNASRLNEGTSNFYFVNASKVFAVGIDKGEDEDKNEDYDEEDVIELMLEPLAGLGYEPNRKKSSPKDDLRSYPGVVIASKTINKDFDTVSASLTIESIVRSGYYQGHNFDWSIEAEVCGKTYDTKELKDVYDLLDDIKDDVRYEMGKDEVDEEVEKISDEIVKWLNSTRDALVNELEKAYSENTTVLNVMVTFSNGETVYRKAD